jgi:DNA-binding SARP family transcriptional activator
VVDTRALSRPSSADGGPHLRFQLMGRFAGWRDGHLLDDRDVGSRKGRTLLKLLLLSPEEPVSLDRLAESIWDGAPPDRVERNVASLVSRLRGVLGSDAIEGGAGTYRVRPSERLEVDVIEAERLAGQGRAQLAADEPALAWTAAERGLDLLGDRELLEDEPDAPWLADARSVVARLRRQLRGIAWQAALELARFDDAAEMAAAALRADPLDEEACRALMRAHQRRGETAAALAAYGRLRSRLAEELGVDPSPLTREVHAALLREEPVNIPPPARPSQVSQERSGDPFVGRDRELAHLGERWAGAADGRAALVAVVGEAGIGKTRLVDRALDLARATGGIAIRVRCYPAERSLFLGPVVEALRSLARHTAPEDLRTAADRWAGTLAALVPEIEDVLRPHGYEPASADVERRRIFAAITSLLRTSSLRRPLFVFLDDLHEAGASTVEFLHYLFRHAEGSRLLAVATLRVEEAEHALEQLADVAERLDLGPLTPDAVSTLAQAAGASHLASRIMAMSRGHTLSVVETLEVLGAEDASGELDAPPVPESLEAAVLARIRRAGPEVEELLRAAATLGSTFDLEVSAGLLDHPLETAVRLADRAIAARLLVEDGPWLAFANDLIREIVVRTTPRAVRTAWHRRAMELLADNPEALAVHASAAGDWGRAIEAWLQAADRAASRYASRDAERLLGRALEVADAAEDPAGKARAYLARGGAREALADYEGALADLEAAVEQARAAARADLEAAALRGLGGDVLVGLGRPSAECLPYLEAGLEVARAADDGPREIEILARLAIVWSNRARFDLAAEHAERARGRARELGDDRALALALDGVKTVAAYTGDLPTLAAILPELERRLQERGELWRLQWAVFESAITPIAQARWRAAAIAIDRAVAIAQRTGYPYAAMFVAQRAWLHRAQGEYDAALASGVEAAALAAELGHPWWVAFAAAMHGWTLTEVGNLDGAVACLETGVAAAERDGMEGYLLRCVCHLALAHSRRGDDDEAGRLLAWARRLIAGVGVPPGHAFLHGAHAYAAAARVHLDRGEGDDADRLLEDVRLPAERAGWREVVATDRVLRGRGRRLAGEPGPARRLLDEDVVIAEAGELRPLALEAHTELAALHAEGGDDDLAMTHTRAADGLREAIATEPAVPAPQPTATPLQRPG